MFQKQVYKLSGAGVPGELYNDGPVKAQAFVLDSTDESNNVVGRAFTVKSQGVAQAGNPTGNAQLAGILVNPKAYALFGQVGTASLTLPNGTNAEFATMGSFFVLLEQAAEIGDDVIYDNTTGVIETMASGSEIPDGKSYLMALVDVFTVTGEGLAVITINKLPVPVGGSGPSGSGVFIDRDGEVFSNRNGDEFESREESNKLTATQERAAKIAENKAKAEAKKLEAKAKAETKGDK